MFWKNLTSGQGSVIGGAISGISGLIGGFMDSHNASQNRAHQEKMWQKNYDAQKEFYQNSIQWRVQDANRAGIHPLYALGGQGANYTPTSTYDSDSSSIGQSVAHAGAQMGIAISEATLRKELAEARGKEMDNYQKALSIAQKEMGQTDNILASISKGFDSLASIKKAEWQTKENLSPATQFYKNNQHRGFAQGLDQNMLDPASEAMFGIGALPDVISSVVSSYSSNMAGMQKMLTDMKVQDYINVKESRPFSNAFRPVYEFEPTSRFHSLSKSKQKEIMAIIRSLNNLE